MSHHPNSPLQEADSVDIPSYQYPRIIENSSVLPAAMDSAAMAIPTPLPRLIEIKSSYSPITSSVSAEGNLDNEDISKYFTEEETDCFSNKNIGHIQELSEGRFGIFVEELDGFIRLGSFPFFKLPKDIRRQILVILIVPFYEYYLQRGYRFIQLFLSKADEQFSLDYGHEDMDFDSFLERQKMSRSWPIVYKDNDTNDYALSPQDMRFKRPPTKEIR
ncbi:hypothetical protein IFR05_004846 [Cadophora sp. M221]|nr:hypothetical protein IFR05_004846 [Cadophora sp. M221]